MSLCEKLKKYFSQTPKEQVLKDWEETKSYDNVNSPTVRQLRLHGVVKSDCGHKAKVLTKEVCNQV